MNPGPDGADRPVTLQVLRLRGLGAFNRRISSRFRPTRRPRSGADLVGASQVAVAPGATAATTVSFEPEAVFVGLVALLRDPGGRVWRTSAPVAPGIERHGERHARAGRHGTGARLIGRRE
jgi:type VI secretion system protein VasD